MLRPAVLLFATSAATILPAQEPLPRTPVQLDSGAVAASAIGFRSWKVTTSRTELPADPSRGLVATARVVHAAWLDLVGTDFVVRVLRSVDGGYTWDRTQAVDVWRNATASGERMFVNDIGFSADGHEVYVAIRSNRRPSGQSPTNTNENLWICASNDQGQTWQSVCATVGLEQALSTRDQLLDVDDLSIAASAGSCHVAFEADYAYAVGVNGQSQIHDIFYQAVGFDGSGTLVRRFAEERKMGTAPSGTVDSDRPSVVADGPTVMCSWQDDRVMLGNNALNNTFSRVSRDAGTTFDAEHDHTQFNGTQPVNMRQSKSAIDGNNLYVFQEDHRNFSDDDVYLSFSNDAGRTWTDNVTISLSPQGIDSDVVHFACVDGHVYVAYADDRNGRGNGNNDVFFVADRNAGADFLAGTHVEVQVTTDPRNNYPRCVAAAGEVVAITYDSSEARGNGAYVAVSVDGGATFTDFVAQNGVTSDTDDPFVTVSRQRDIQVTWADDGGVNNFRNRAYTAGVKVPILEDRTASGGGLVLRMHTVAENGNPALLLGSLAGPYANGLPLDPHQGLFLNLLPDGLSLAMAGNTGVFLSTVFGDEATWSFPRFSVWLNADIWFAAAEIDLLTGAPSQVHSDPIVQSR
ncbi:MAG: sialidase family protein [Planctomycetota bacterium]|nr:sialidase family protein [Planctomycetota bacterium]